MEQAVLLRKQGFGYHTIGKKINVKGMTVRNWVSHITCDRSVSQSLGKGNVRHVNPETCITNGPRKRALVRERGHKCEECGLSEWLGNPIPLTIHHINGDKHNNTRENMKLLCENCHALTKNYCGRNSRRWKNNFGEGVRIIPA